jgi:hypothetical protein
VHQTTDLDISPLFLKSPLKLNPRYKRLFTHVSSPHGPHGTEKTSEISPVAGDSFAFAFGIPLLPLQRHTIFSLHIAKGIIEIRRATE